MRHAALLLALSCCAAGAARAQPAPAPAPEPTLWGLQPALPVVTPRDGAATRALATYQLPETKFPVHLGPAKATRRVVEREARFPSPLREKWPEIHGTYYAPARVEPGERLPAAVVVHHLGGSFEAEQYLARHLAQNGVPSFAISLPNYGQRRVPGTREGFLDTRDPIGSFAGFRQAALDVIRAADFLRAMPEVDPDRVGAVGVSLGAIVTALAKGVDPRLGRTVLVIGGGDIARLLTESPEAQDYIARNPELTQLIRPEDLSAALVPVDPLTFAGRVRAEDVLMLNARRDEIIPERCTHALWEAMGRPRIRWFNCGHYGIVLHLITVMNESLDHLRG